MRDTIGIECLMEAMERYVEAKVEHDKARDEYIEGGGYSWGYYGREYVEKKEKAAEEVQKWLIDLVKKSTSP